jgi:formylglycine-generating enzyme required for sulfatase activity
MIHSRSSATKRLLAAAATLAIAGAAFSVGLIVARAKPGGETRKSLSFAGRLRGTTGAQSLTFSFKKGGVTQCEPKVTASPDASGAFNVEIPLAGCPNALFDGGDITFDVSVGGTVIAKDQAVNPVPYARYADQAGSPDCPNGYSRDASITTFVLCARTGDEVVKVGAGPSAFWIDRYEASVWSNPDGSGTQFGAAGADYPVTFPANGQWTAPVYALSRGGVVASRFITWFQASEACASSGKRLPTNAEWLRAARGTPDPAVGSDGSGGTCITNAPAPRKMGDGSACVSAAGAQDMVGNSWEWIEEWYTGLGDATFATAPWPGGFGGDYTYNIVNRAATTPTTVPVGAPGGVLRGGGTAEGAAAGIFAVYALYAPSGSSTVFGFRCMTPR